jgi:hypothetical protein
MHPSFPVCQRIHGLLKSGVVIDLLPRWFFYCERLVQRYYTNHILNSFKLARDSPPYSYLETSAKLECRRIGLDEAIQLRRV